MDGHERQDVVRYREIFLEQMANLELRMNKYDGDSMTQMVSPELSENEKRVVWICHDETTIYSNDATKVVWVRKDDCETLRPKSNGSSIMISGFICSCHGFIQDEVNVNGVMEVRQSYQIFRHGKNNEGYWTNDHLAHRIADTGLSFFQSIIVSSILLRWSGVISKECFDLNALTTSKRY